MENEAVIKLLREIRDAIKDQTTAIETLTDMYAHGRPLDSIENKLDKIIDALYDEDRPKGV